MVKSPIGTEEIAGLGGDGLSVVSRASDVLSEGLERPLKAGLYIVATPIGNLGDITLRALNVLARADVICCEDTRHSRKLLSHFSIKGRLQAYHEHNAEKERPALLALLARGKSVALISDAGTPLISDPGYKLVEEVLDKGYSVTTLPGAAAPIAALTLAGLPTDRFYFEGFLPSKSGQRVNRLEALRDVPATLIFFESAKRLGASVADMAACLGTREASIVKELTKRFEGVVRGSLSDLAAQVSGADHRGEFVVVVAPPAIEKISDEEIAERLRSVLKAQSFRDGVKMVSDALCVNKSRVYAIGLQLQEKDDGEASS